MYKSLFFVVFIFAAHGAVGQFRQVTPTDVPEGVVAISEPGSYGVPGTTYMLTRDITSEATTLFLGKDVTLDLNGYTIRYADGKYEHIPNSGFEEGDKGWDLSRAPGARVVNTKDVHVFIGEKIMQLKKGDELLSPYINLPVANRSYFAMCGVTGHDWQDMNGDLANQMKVSIFVEDENGNEIRTVTQYGDTTLQSVPVEKRAPRLGGGFVFAHLHGLPAGKYRMRVRAETDCLVDEIDIRPAMDVGIGIVEKTYPMGHYDHLYSSTFAAFFDYTKDVEKGQPLDFIPQVEGGGTVIIKNGTIENGVKGIMSWGVQSTASNVKIILDNVKFVTSGINTIAVDVPQATITHCRFEVDNPFIINRHYSNFYAVDLRGKHASEVSYSEFFGGQGCLVFKGKHSSIHHNYFVNKQMVTNHYSIMAMGDSSKVFENRIEPEVGSGIEIYVRKYIEIFNNVIRIKTSPPTCEYGHDEYSTSAVRLADYRAKPGSPKGCYGNKVYNNKIHITALPQSGVDSYMPMAWAIYYSATGGDNDIFGNEITMHKPDPDAKVLTTAFYICGGLEGYGGRFYNNKITTNVPAAWIGTHYGGAANSKIFNNTIVKSPDTPADFHPFQMGSTRGRDMIAKNIEFRSNTFVNTKFSIAQTEQPHSYDVYWTLTGKLLDKKGRPLANVPLTILDREKNAVFTGISDNQGSFTAELKQYSVAGSERSAKSPYTIVTGRTKKEVTLEGNTDMVITVGR